MEAKTKDKSRDYVHSMHRFGRNASIIAIIVMLSMPVIAGIYFDATPGFLQVFTASAGLLSIFVPTAIGELISYTPVLGSSIYLTLITGNVMNLKLPVAANAMQLLDTPYGSEEADVIGSIAVSISSFITITIIIMGVILMIPLRPALSIPAVKTSTAYILPALFGNLVIRQMNPGLGGGATSPNRLKGAVIPFILVVMLALLDKYLLSNGILKPTQSIMGIYRGVVILVLLPILYFQTKWLYNKGKINVYLPEDDKLKL